MEGQREIAFRARGPGASRFAAARSSRSPPARASRCVRATRRPRSWFTTRCSPRRRSPRARARSTRPGATWRERGVAVRDRVDGRGLRDRRPGGGQPPRAPPRRRRRLRGGRARGARRIACASRFDARATLHAEVVARPRGTLELRAEGGAPLGEADAALWLDVDGDAGFVVEGVEHERGAEGARARIAPTGGRLYVTLDAHGALAAVHGVPLEELLRGLVPSEMPASSPLEALKAQAVTARSNVLAQIGARHATDPFMLCAEVHCQAYRGDAARTRAHRRGGARDARRGALRRAPTGRLVDAVYSAICGGHGEDNDRARLGQRREREPARPVPTCRGPERARWDGGLAREARLRAFLADAGRRLVPPRRRARGHALPLGAHASAAPRSTGGRAARASGTCARLSVGARGVSGRARVLAVEGDRGRAEIAGELRIRRLLGNLPSAMFVVDRAGDGVVLRGGGWGHGAGMCQWGAVGRAEAGHGHREILGAYYLGRGGRADLLTRARSDPRAARRRPRVARPAVAGHGERRPRSCRRV